MISLSRWCRISSSIARRSCTVNKTGLPSDDPRGRDSGLVSGDNLVASVEAGEPGASQGGKKGPSKHTVNFLDAQKGQFSAEEDVFTCTKHSNLFNTEIQYCMSYPYKYSSYSISLNSWLQNSLKRQLSAREIMGSPRNK